MARMPAQRPGKSFQSYQTPPAFLRAVRHLLDITDFDVDLAASADNMVTTRFYDEAYDSLKREGDWATGGWNYCNPPFSKLGPWVHKAATERLLGARVAMLVPASVGSLWWFDWVHKVASVRFLHPRLSFVGTGAPFPKDLALLLYSPALPAGYEAWRWLQ